MKPTVPVPFRFQVRRSQVPCSGVPRSARALASRSPRSSQRAARWRPARTVSRRALCVVALVAAALSPLPWDRSGSRAFPSRSISRRSIPIVAEWLMSRRLHAAQGQSEQPGGRRRRPRMMMMGFLLSTVVPDVWWFVMGGIVCGLALGMTLAYRRRHHPMATDGRIHTGQLKDLFA